jgi:glycine dehydrogenase
MNQSQITIEERPSRPDEPGGPAGAAASIPSEPSSPSVLDPTDTFVHRHLGPDDREIRAMLALVGFDSLDALTDAVVPESIRLSRPLDLAPPAADARGEHELIATLRAIAGRNQVQRSFIGMGYANSIVPPVIQRNILENPGWYTQYTPYQSEISQGRLEALLAFQTMVIDLTGLPVAGASLLDEATAAAEAMSMCHRIITSRNAFFVADDCHPQTIEVVRSRAESQGVELIVGRVADLDVAAHDLCGVLVQYPATDGRIVDHRGLVQRAHDAGTLVVVAADLMALTLLVPPGEIGADIAVGSTQRFGVPMGAGGPHAAYMATTEQHVRKMPGRLIGISKDVHDRPALRMAIQTREQHIRRDRATSNICTAQVLLAIMAAMYAVYHGPAGLRRIATRIHRATAILREGLARLGHQVPTSREVFDTLRVTLRDGMTASQVLEAARTRGINLRDLGDGTIGVSLDETVTPADLQDLLACFGGGSGETLPVASPADDGFDDSLRRTSDFLTHAVFNAHHSETEMLRYLKRLESRDLSLAQSMIPLGSCTMKLNATSEMLPVTWPEFVDIHPFAPVDQMRGYAELYRQLESWLAEITGFDAVSLQPNAGSQGEYAGLMVIRAWHRYRGDEQRHVCLISPPE